MNEQARETLTVKRLRELLTYDPITGIFRWRVKVARNTIIGSIAGTLTSAGYLQIRLLGRQPFYGHRLAWLYVFGTWPTDEIDHIDGNPANNAWENLRAAMRQENCRNTARPSHNTSGIKGVSWDKQKQAWRAYIVVARKQTFLGYFAEKQNAADAYERAANKTFGQFARVA